MESSTFLYDVSPLVVERLCRILDSGGDSFGWRALAVRIAPSLLEIRMLERDMGHHRALQFFQSQTKGSASPPSTRHAESSSPMSAPTVNADLLFPLLTADVPEESHQLEVSSSSQASHPLRPAEETSSPILTFQDIIEGSRDFHPEMRIAEGHFTDVYKAQKGNKTFAAKLFKQENTASWKQLWDIFRKEMEIHHLYQHPNILDLLGCFSDEGRYCLVYPYLPNGSLFHRLHHQDRGDPLSWQERLNIIKGVAKALHHLHTAQPCPVICGNISSTNIFLDDDLEPKLSDFGLARLRPNCANQYCTITLDTSYHSNPGYLPEEYIRDGKLSFSLDVYSFGMVIMETVTGRKVTEDVPKKTQLRDLLITEVEDSGGVDSCLQFLDKKAGRWPTALALSLLGLALDCTASRHRSRPDMKNVLYALSRLLPPPACPPADQPYSLDDRAPLHVQQLPLSSIPVEHDEHYSLPGAPAQEGPCECSQSEVTYISDTVGAHGVADVDLYSSWPVQCSCPAETGGLACEDCRANGFTPNHTDSIQSDFSVMENAAKQRLRNKLSLYNGGRIHTEELFSETGLQPS
ncbi:hypothetical protein Q5P01_003317 [Channa striata]|uniref:Protein kinase domain-containing protein n=1 Tax=Channa striata TaxID=64152 RepID=A0AA88NHJ8_CHASR|nr:hypothetical protein Q5P01_003317 [Channa striata]